MVEHPTGQPVDEFGHDRAGVGVKAVHVGLDAVAGVELSPRVNVFGGQAQGSATDISAVRGEPVGCRSQVGCPCCVGVSQASTEFLSRLTGGTDRGELGFREPTIAMVQHLDDRSSSGLGSREPCQPGNLVVDGVLVVVGLTKGHVSHGRRVGCSRNHLVHQNGVSCLPVITS